MKNFLPIGRLNVIPALLDLKLNPDAWDRYSERANAYGPHQGVSDVWVRYRDRAEFNGSWEDFVNQPHEAVWYPEAECLPAVKDICFELMHWVRGERLGGVIITRIPPGGKVDPHIDGGFNAMHYNCKVMVTLEGHPDQALHYEEGSYSAQPGECVWFNNRRTHWVTNDSPVDRISLVVCMRTDRSALCRLPQLEP